MVSLPNYAGCRSAPWCWWVTAATPSWTCSTAANRWRNPLPSSPACLDFVHLRGVGEDVGELSVNCGWGFSAVGFQPRQWNMSVGQPQHEVRRFGHVSNFCAKSSLRLDAALYEPAPARQPGRNGRPPLKGRRLPALKALLDLPTVSWVEVSVAWYNGATRTVELTSQTAVWYRSGKPPVPLRWVLVRDPQGEFATQALLCTDLAVEPAQILEWFVLRWQLEVTFQEVRAHLGVETQRQWSDRAIARTTPILMGLFSWTTLAAHLMQEQRPMSHRTAAWYAKPSPTFVDAIALVRRHLWLASEGFHCPTQNRIYGKSRLPCTTD